MSHLHIPDGVLPVWLWVGGWLVTLVAVTLAGRYSEREDLRRKVPLVAIVAALMIVAMSSEIVPIAYHVNLSILGGVLLGPALSIIAAFIIQIVLALLGHGGVTVLGLNTVMSATEMIVGWALFSLIAHRFGRTRVRAAAFITTIVTLALTTTLLVGIVAIGGAAASGRETGALDPGTLKFENPFAQGVFEVGLLGGSEHDDETEGDGASAATPEDAEKGGLALGRFAIVVFTLGPIGWILEALLTAAILGYAAQVRPGLIWSGTLTPSRPRPPGDENSAG